MGSNSIYSLAKFLICWAFIIFGWVSRRVSGDHRIYDRTMIDSENASSVSVRLRFVKFIFKLSIGIASMPYNANINDSFFLIDRIDYSILTNSYTPKLDRPLKLSATAWSRILFEGFDSIEYTLGGVSRQLLQLFACRTRECNLVFRHLSFAQDSPSNII